MMLVKGSRHHRPEGLRHLHYSTLRWHPLDESKESGTAVGFAHEQSYPI